MTGTGRHRCPASRCPRAVRDEYLMCGEHWRKVPREIQHKVWRAYQPRQSIATASREYLEAMNEAVEAVDRAEGRA